MSFIREIAELYRFFKKTPVEKRAIVFYAEHSGYFSYFEGLLRGLTGKYRQSLCYVTSDVCDPIFNCTNSAIRPFYINKLLPVFMTMINCKTFVMTLTDLNQYYLKRSALPVHYVYVFHSLVSTHMMYRESAFDHYDSILCAGPHHVEEIRRRERICNLKPKRLVEAGYYRIERIYNQYCNRPAEHDERRKRTVLIAPSWGKNNLIESCGDKLVDVLLKAGYEVIVRPHPETVRRFSAMINSLERKYKDDENFMLERSVATDDSLLKADVLVCDCSGVYLEYAFGTERPVLFVDLPLKIKNPDYKRLEIEPLELRLRPEVGAMMSQNELDTAPQRIKELITRRNEYRERIVKLRNKYIFNFGQSSEIGTKHIIDVVSGG